MSHAATLVPLDARRNATVIEFKKTVDRWLPRRRSVADHRPQALAEVRPFIAPESRGAVPRVERHRPQVDVMIELEGTRGILRRDGRSVVIAGAGESLSARLLGMIADEANLVHHALTVVIRERGKDLAMSVHPDGCIEALSACCA